MLFYEAANFIIYAIVWIWAAFVMYAMLRAAFSAFSSLPSSGWWKRVNLYTIVRIYSIYICGAVLSMMGIPLLDNFLLQKGGVAASITLGLATIGFVRLLTLIRRSESIAETVVIWIPTAFGGIAFYAMYNGQRLYETAMMIHKAVEEKSQPVSILLIVGSLIILLFVESLGELARRSIQ